MADQTLPTLDPREFRKLLGLYATGVCVVTAAVEGKLAGVTANSFTSVSMDPPLVLWSIQNTSTSIDVFLSSTHFAINILASSQIDLSRRFSKSDGPKFDDFEYSFGSCGSPVFPGVLATIHCMREVEYKAGDHTIMVGRVTDFTSGAGQPLVFSQGRFAVTLEEPPTQAEPSTPDADDPFLSMQLLSAYESVRRRMDAIRARRGIELNEGRILTVVASGGGATPELLARTYLSRRAFDDAVGSLLSKGLLAISSSGRLELSETGQSCHARMMEETRDLDRALLAKFSPDAVAKTKTVLDTLSAHE